MRLNPILPVNQRGPGLSLRGRAFFHLYSICTHGVKLQHLLQDYEQLFQNMEKQLTPT